MKTIKTNTVLKTFKGEPVKDGDKDLTIGAMLSFILGGKVSNPAFGWQFGKKFATEKEVELKAEDVVTLIKEIKDYSARDGASGALVTGQLIDMLDGKDEEEKTKK